MIIYDERSPAAPFLAPPIPTYADKLTGSHSSNQVQHGSSPFEHKSVSPASQTGQTIELLKKEVADNCAKNGSNEAPIQENGESDGGDNGCNVGRGLTQLVSRMNTAGHQHQSQHGYHAEAELQRLQQVLPNAWPYGVGNSQQWENSLNTTMGTGVPNAAKADGGASTGNGPYMQSRALFSPLHLQLHNSTTNGSNQQGNMAASYQPNGYNGHAMCNESFFTEDLHLGLGRMTLNGQDSNNTANSNGSIGGGEPINHQHITESVEVPSSEHVAEIVGRQGCKIKALRAKTNTYIKTPVRGEEPFFIVTGRPEDVLEAKREIECAAEHFTQIRASRRHSQGGAPAPGHVTTYVRVPLRVVGLVVGPKGATIKRIQQDTHTYIITPSREREPIFEVTGLPQNVEAARREIEQHIYQRTGNMPITDQNASLSNFAVNFDFGTAAAQAQMATRPHCGGLVSARAAAGNGESNSHSHHHQQHAGGYGGVAQAVDYLQQQYQQHHPHQQHAASVQSLPERTYNAGFGAFAENFNSRNGSYGPGSGSQLGGATHSSLGPVGAGAIHTSGMPQQAQDSFFDSLELVSARHNQLASLGKGSSNGLVHNAIASNSNLLRSISGPQQLPTTHDSRWTWSNIGSAELGGHHSHKSSDEQGFFSAPAKQESARTSHFLFGDLTNGGSPATFALAGGGGSSSGVSSINGGGLSSTNSTSRDEGLGDSPTNSFGKLGSDPYHLMISSIWSDLDSTPRDNSIGKPNIATA